MLILVLVLEIFLRSLFPEVSGIRTFEDVMDSFFCSATETANMRNVQTNTVEVIMVHEKPSMLII